ncbi:hypothetical protein AHAS_Ahas05G0080100 [Arachis hypogaea]
MCRRPSTAKSQCWSCCDESETATLILGFTAAAMKLKGKGVVMLNYAIATSR